MWHIFNLTTDHLIARTQTVSWFHLVEIVWHPSSAPRFCNRHSYKRVCLRRLWKNGVQWWQRHIIQTKNYIFMTHSQLLQCFWMLITPIHSTRNQLLCLKYFNDQNLDLHLWLIALFYFLYHLYFSKCFTLKFFRKIFHLIE